MIDLGGDMDPITRARAFQFIELGEDGAGDAGGSRAAAHVLLRNALREARDLRLPIGARGPARGAVARRRPRTCPKTPISAGARSAPTTCC